MTLKHRGFNAILLMLVLMVGCKKGSEQQNTQTNDVVSPKLNLMQANRLASLPFGCIQTEYPNKLGQTLHDSTHLKNPKTLHPAFYGCFDWHSSVHGHWSLVSLLRQFPEVNEAEAIRAKLIDNLSKENIEGELAYFNMEGNATYERTYGWAWLLKLAEELHTWDDPMAKELDANLQPLVEIIIKGYIDFLPKLNYPIRVGEHSNTAFGMSLAWDYAQTTNHIELKKVIENSVIRFYMSDIECPLNWEPSGFDFLSPCLQEVDIVRKVLSKEEFKKWFKSFLPMMTNTSFTLEPGKVSDRTDGKLVHIDGLNFSRAWCLYGIAETLPEYAHLRNIADEHITYSLPSIVDGNYEGTHWLGTFALYALNHSE
ncbi:DUF2891 domain-containing protein [Maribacter arenosus]|uniref:DUF2891 domain-containing protein n=1 Tax=Maribacter arenosus TaxID=1854708 RepID=A0ABR7V7L5_9FLAO|nr:DUF2891 domain-containing protein [Maribacter arenosus]MBD0849683.1 DUF2891 domain-containing protein [Maribacter arenosus]